MSGMARDVTDRFPPANAKRWRKGKSNDPVAKMLWREIGRAGAGSDPSLSVAPAPRPPVPVPVGAGGWPGIPAMTAVRAALFLRLRRNDRSPLP